MIEKNVAKHIQNEALSLSLFRKLFLKSKFFEE